MAKTLLAWFCGAIVLGLVAGSAGAAPKIRVVTSTTDLKARAP